MSVKMPASDGPLFIILSAASGANDAGSTRALIADLLQTAGRAHELNMVDDGSQLADIARQTIDKANAQGGAVIVAGGDGAINAVVQALGDTPCPFGVIPQGTFNYFARSHGIPTDAGDATRALLRARIHPVQIGLVNDHAFLVNASLGLYPQLLEDREAYKRQFGRSRLVAMVAGIVSLFREHRQLRIRLEVDGVARETRTPTLFVGNNRLQLEQIGIPLAPVVEAGQLVALTVKPIGTSAMLWLMLLGAFGRLGEADEVISFGVRDMTVRVPTLYRRMRKRIKVATDGETVWLDAPLRIRVAPWPLHLLKADEENRVDEENRAAGSVTLQGAS